MGIALTGGRGWSKTRRGLSLGLLTALHLLATGLAFLYSFSFQNDESAYTNAAASLGERISDAAVAIFCFPLVTAALHRDLGPFRSDGELPVIMLFGGNSLLWASLILG